MQDTSWWMDIIRSLLFSLDKIVYGLVETLYNLFIFISDLTIFNNNDFDKFTGKIYLILGIVMLFKTAFSLISLFANPDDIADSGKGVTGIVKRIIVSLIVITFIPTVFSTAYRIQSIILKDNVIGNFFLGDITNASGEKDLAGAEEIQKNSGKMISYSVLSAFYYPEDFIFQYTTTEDGIRELKTDGEKYLYSEDVRMSSDACNVDNVCDGELYYQIKNQTYSIYDSGNFIVKEDESRDVYVMNYMFLISTVAGLAVAWIFLGFCFDIAIRSVKLAVLQLIAPIPIFSYIDPKKGESIFKNWYTTCISTYLNIFMRLIIIFLVIYICYIIGSSGIQQFDANGIPVPLKASGGMELLAKAMMIFGVLMFAKDAPKLFSEMFGIKSQGSFGTTLAKMGMAGTGLAVGVGGAKYLGSKYRRGFQKATNRRSIGSINDKLRSDELSDDERASLNEEKTKLQMQNKWSTGLKENFNATRYGAAAGFGGGWAAKNITGAGLKKGIMSAHNTEKIRNNGVSFVGQTKARIDGYAGIANKYGEFNKYKGEYDELTNKRHDVKKMEDRLSENYVDKMTSTYQEYGIDETLGFKYDQALKANNADEVEKIKLEIAENYANKNYAKNAKKRDDAIKDVSSKLVELENIQKNVSVYNKEGEKLEGKIKTAKSKLEANNEGK